MGSPEEYPERRSTVIGGRPRNFDTGALKLLQFMTGCAQEAFPGGGRACASP
jgi:hypothetical protein